MAIIELGSDELEENKGREWILPNLWGGYSCSTVEGKSSREYHGILVSHPHASNFKRDILVQNLEEKISLASQEGVFLYQNLKKFEWAPRLVTFHFSTEQAEVKKRVRPLLEHEGVEVRYKIKNKNNSELQFTINLILTAEAKNFKLWNEHTLGFSSGGSYILVFSDYARCFENRSLEKEGSFIPARFLLTLRESEEKEIKIIALCGDSEERALQEFRKIEVKGEGIQQERVLSSGPGVPLFSLLSTTQGFIVNREPKLGVIAGYPYYGERGRDTLLSLPGLTLIGSNFRAAELILERFLNKATPQGVPSEWVDGEPGYDDNVDTTLWLVDRLYQYMQYVGEEKFKPFLHTYWWNLKDIFKSYGEKEKGGLLRVDGRTWMEEVKRENAIEIQGLWYNALKIMEKFSNLMEESGEVYFSSAQAHEETFLENFGEGSYLKDSLNDASFRPGQVIVLGLDFNVVPDDLAKNILHQVEKELLTPYGLRTLCRGEGGYDAGSKFNGGAWPWLLGSFIKARVRSFPNERKGNYKFIKTLFESEVKRNCLGTIAEFFNSESGEPRGNLSYACSVAELLRAYFEDILGRKGAPKSEIYVSSSI